MSKINVKNVRELLQNFEFERLFVEELGWNNPVSRRANVVSVEGGTFTYTSIAVLGGVEVFKVTPEAGASIPNRKDLMAISKEIARVRLEHVLVFVDKDRTQSLWFWVKREGTKRVPREHTYFKGQPGDLFISKLAAMSVDISELDDLGQISLLEAAQKVQNALDIERVIKRFYGDYDRQRIEFTALIGGIPDDQDRKWYASVLLNRLMFIYFLQKKFFLDGGDGNYLESKFAQSKANGIDQFYSGFLQVLFFEAFALPEQKRSAETKQITGKIKYLNGGLFLKHRLEEQYTITVPDRAFEGLLGLFGDYSWSLNDVAGEQDNDINPDVLGYIFEKYINQKEFGAYYTKPEITEYLCEHTIFQLILDRVRTEAIPGLPAPRNFDSVPEMLMHLDSVTARRLLSDVLPSLTILDPAVGSGAFLVASLKTLISVYSAVIGWLRFHDMAWLESFLQTKWTHSPNKEQYAIKKAIITDNLYGVDIMEEAAEIAKLRLFMALVASAETVDDLEPLPNIDFNILSGNSLIGLTRIQDAEYESNVRLKNPNLSLFAPEKSYREILTERNRKVDAYRHASGYAEDLAALRKGVQQIEDDARPVLTSILVQAFDELGVKYEQATWDDKTEEIGRPKKHAVTAEHIDRLHPFHWGFEFDKILNEKGGFDAIVTNPPWDILKPQDKEFFMRYSDVISKNKMSITEFDSQKSQYMHNQEIRRAYLNYLSEFPHVTKYFKTAPEYSNQSSRVFGKRTGTDANLYKLFVERCYHLLRKGGLCGIVIPSGIYSDLGSTGLRKLLFENTTVTGLFCFENRKEVFEGVHRSFKFSLLTYKKAGSTSKFPAAFMRHEASDLERFPDSVGMNICVDNVRLMFPETLAIMELKSDIEFEIAAKMARYPRFGDETAGHWSIRLMREFDMTLDKGLFKYESRAGRLPLYEGKMIHQFNHKFAGPTRWVDETEGRASIVGREESLDVVPDYKKYRLAHRAIARSTDERTMIATILPKNVFYGNSLYASRRPAHGSVELYVLSFLNSFCTDYYLRQLVSANLNLTFIYQLPVPRLTKEDAQFLSLVRRAARLICTTEEFADLWNEIDAEIGLNPLGLSPRSNRCAWTPNMPATAEHDRDRLRAEIDGLAAHMYGLSEEEFNHVLSTFPLVDTGVRDAALAAYRSVAAGRIL